MNLPPFLAARVRGPFISVALVCMLGVVCAGIRAQAERPPLTKNVPVWEFQNKGDGSSYDFDAPPKGIFHTIEFAENFEQELGFRRTHDFIPVNPTEQFRSDSEPVFIVFTLHKHYDSFQVTGLCYPERVEGMKAAGVVAEDTAQLSLEDNSGYLKLFAPEGGWKPGTYKVEIHLGWEVNEISLIGTMRFTIVA